MPIRLLLADDHTIVREGVTFLLAAQAALAGEPWEYPVSTI